MEVEKRGVKGGFLQLFDWNGKSRKKLFSNKSDSPESSNHVKENFFGSAIPRHQRGVENGFPSGAENYNGYRHASSAAIDSDYGTKAPGVVARLMGLDSLPKSNVTEPCYTQFIESHPFRDSSYLRSASAFQSEHDIVIFESVRNKLDGSIRNPLDLRLQKVQNRPIERFQTEVLPPKSAKPISITHHRLLSPIKSPGFIPPKNAAYIIEAAAKIIEQSPRSSSKGKMPSLGPPSLPLRVRNLKDNMETAHRSSRPADASQRGNIKKQLSARDQGRSDGNYLSKGSEESKAVGSRRLKSKEKSVSLAVQAKANIQKRDGGPSFGNRSSERQREHNNVRPSSSSRSLPNTQKKMEKQSSSRKPSEALKLNHQKQNSACTKDTESFDPLSSHLRDRKESNLSTNYTYGRANRTLNKAVVNNAVTSRKKNLMEADPGKELSSSRAKTTAKNKLPINGFIQSDEEDSQVAPLWKDKKSIKCNLAFEGDHIWDPLDKKNSLDVVSFTFTSPIKKLGAGSSSYGNNTIGGDALSMLLEQKLKELTSMVELSQQDLLETESAFSSSANSYGEMSPAVNLVKSLGVIDEICRRKQERQDSSDCLIVDKDWQKAENGNKGPEHLEKIGDSSNTEYQGYLHLRETTSVSNRPSLSGASVDSFDGDRSLSNEGSMQGLSLESYENMTGSSSRKHHPAECDAEMSDTASSLSVGTISETATSSLYVIDTRDSSYWELQYIGNILGSTELMLEEFALGEAHKIIPPDLFDRLENKKLESNKVMQERFVLERRLLFDCVSECLEVRCGRLLAGSYEFWAKQRTLLHTPQWLVEELYREISSWANIEESMVDELVDKDMSCKHGKWTDFELEAFEEGVEIEERILTHLVDELIDDFLF